jgi:hypothetical protein
VKNSEHFIRFILNAIWDLLTAEYIGNQHWREDEYKAFQEAVERFGWKYEYLCFSFFTKQVALRIL